MTDFTIRAENMDEVKAALRKYGRDAERAIGGAVMASALSIDRDAKKRIQRGPKTGRVYQLSNPTRTHQSSAPGQSPATDTGGLVSAQTVKQGPNKLTAHIDNTKEAAKHLEGGTQRMAPRPFMAPAVEAKKSEFARRVADAIRGLQ